MLFARGFQKTLYIYRRCPPVSWQNLIFILFIIFLFFLLFLFKSDFYFETFQLQRFRLKAMLNLGLLDPLRWCRAHMQQFVPKFWNLECQLFPTLNSCDSFPRFWWRKSSKLLIIKASLAMTS